MSYEQSKSFTSDRCLWTGMHCVLAKPVSALYGGRPNGSVYDGAALGKELFGIKNIALTRILLDQGVYISMLVFASGFRQLIVQARKEYEWVGTLLFGTVTFGLQ